MREVGVDGLFSAPDLEIPLDPSSIPTHCKRWLLDVELDLSNSATTFEAVQWAICELQRMELQERYSVPGSHVDDEEDTGSFARSSGRDLRVGSGRRIPEKSPNDQGYKDPVVANRSGICSERESLDKKLINTRIDTDVSPSGPKHHTEEPTNKDVRNWRQIFNVSCKRKSDGEDSDSEGGKRMKVSDLPSKELVQNHGEAGTRMAESIGARLAVPDCIFLTNLVSHCLLVSMDQFPTVYIQDTLAPPKVEGRAESSTGPGPAYQGGRANKGSNDWLWLHKWLVKTVLSDEGDDGRFASLDWLIAFVTAARQSLIKPILDDLASELQKREIEGSVTISSYMRRIGVLEYAAFRWA